MIRRLITRAEVLGKVAGCIDGTLSIEDLSEWDLDIELGDAPLYEPGADDLYARVECCLWEFNYHHIDEATFVDALREIVRDDVPGVLVIAGPAPAVVSGTSSTLSHCAWRPI